MAPEQAGFDLNETPRARGWPDASLTPDDPAGVYAGRWNSEK